MAEKLTFKEFYKKDPRKKAIERAFNTFNKKPLEHINIPSFNSTSYIHRKIPFTDTYDTASPHRGNYSQIRPDHFKNQLEFSNKVGEEVERDKEFRVRSKSPLNTEKISPNKTPLKTDRQGAKDRMSAETIEKERYEQNIYE